MKTILHGTELQVSRLCFGTMTFGSQVRPEEASRIVDLCLDRGINFLDTANVYNGGESERILGGILKGRRDRVVLATKVRGKMGDGPLDCGLSKAAIRHQIDESLRRLQTDYVDLYYLHQPDYDVPVEESLEALDELIRAGKVRYAAASNYAAWQMAEMHAIAARGVFAPVRVTQPMYNLIARGLEPEYLPMAREFGISTVVYNPLAGGLLTGKQSPEAPVAGTRFDNNRMYLDRYWHRDCFDAVEELRGIAQTAGRSLVSLALNWLLHHTPTNCVILGASRIGQLETNIEAAQEGQLTPETVAACDAVWEKLRGVTPKYNR
ncbi:MAG: aldo/keto reductase [Acidobacteria bacterium]|nr:aldo/keto reductase [Acidobacteriota bacterium]